MSEGKPTGADQSTSNGGGGGTSGDPGGKQGALSVVKNGLGLRQKEEEKPLGNFDYVWAPTTAEPLPFNWTSFTTESVQFDHIQCHYLKEGDDLPVMVTELDNNPNAMALVLVNKENTYNVDPNYLPESGATWAFPILVVTSETGDKIKTILGEHAEKVEVEVTIPALSQIPESNIRTIAERQVDVPKHHEFSLTGLVIEVEGEDNLNCTYGWATINTLETPVNIDWQPLSKLELDYPHIQCHQLQDQDDISALTKHLGGNKNTVAVIIINTENSYHIDPKHFPDEVKSPIPVLVVTPETGQMLNEALDPLTKVVKAKVEVATPEVSDHQRKDETVAAAKQASDHPVLNGLQVNVPDARYCVTYDWAPVTASPTAIEWLPLSKGDMSYPHVRCHNLKDSDDIPLLISALDSGSSAAALILINTQENYQIDTALLPMDEKWSIPVLVVHLTAGKFLTDILTQYPRDVEVKVRLESVETVPAQEIIPEDTGIKDIAKHFINYLLPGKRPVENDLASRLKNILFPPEGAKIASNDHGIFQMVMSEFHCFEEEGRDYSEGNITLAMLTERCKETFHDDFPLYMALAYRTSGSKRLGRYRGDSPAGLLNTCVALFEQLSIHSVATTLNGFLARGDFNFQMKYHNSNEVSAFWFLELAFSRLMRESKDTLYRTYPKMAWITVFLRLRALKPPIQSVVTRVWNDNFLKESHHYLLYPANIEGAKQAMSLGEELKLPAEFTFNTRLIGELLTPNGAVRPLHHLTNAVNAFGNWFTFDDDFRRHIVKNLREHYKSWMKKSKTSVKSLSSEGTILGAVKAGLQLLEAMLCVASMKRWKLEQFHDHFQKWFVLLLSWVDFNSDPLLCLQELTSMKFLVVKRHEAFIKEQISEEVQRKMKRMSVQQFFPIYSAFDFWPDQLLGDYFAGSKIPPSSKLSDPAWKDFFAQVTVRLHGASKQRILRQLLLQIGLIYLANKQSVQFIIDLLKLGLPTLFAVRTDSTGQQSSEDKLAVDEFEHDLRHFIRKSAAKQALLTRMKDLMSCITDRQHAYQEHVLSAVHKEIIPDQKDLQDKTKVSLIRAIDTAVNILKGNMTWVNTRPSLQQKFCLDLVNVCCTRIPASQHSFEWMKQFFPVIQQLGSIYHSYASSRKVVGKGIILSDQLPSEVVKNSSTAVSHYFEWIQKLHTILSVWYNMLENESADYDIIHMYNQNQRHIHNLAQAVSASGLVMSASKIVQLQHTFLQRFEEMNQLLLRYIPKDPKAGWCSLISVFTESGIQLPQELTEDLSAHVVFPDEYEIKGATIKLLSNIPSPSTGGQFHPPTQDIHLWLSANVSLKLLDSLLHRLKSTLKPIQEYIDILVFFKLYPSNMFTTYLRSVLRANESPDVSESITVSLPTLRRALEDTKSLLVKVLQGSATYGEIIAQGSLKLEDLDVEGEFEKLLRCPQVGIYGAAGLTGIKSLLKLIQFTGHIHTIWKVCDQYHLKSCLEDPKLLDLQALATRLENEGERAKITSSQAKTLWKNVLSSLCLKDETAIGCLQLFPKVADSIDFYHFLEEKQFTGTKGDALFRQQFELITAQLQHEEYNDTVLNHVLAAFSFIAPFMDTEQEFQTLMTAIRDLDIRTGITQLETVKKNMHLIRLWFSRAEGDTVENVSNELKCIMTTGCYKFRMAPERSRPIRLVLEYEPSSTTASLRGPPILLRQTSASTEFIFGNDRMEVPEAISPEAKQSEVWVTDEINDFVHKLGFFDAKEEEEERVHNFQQLNQTAFKLLHHFRKLRELGHPRYTQKDFRHSLPCSTALKTIDEEVAAVEEDLKTWLHKVEELHASYKWLLFFRVSKLRILHELLVVENPSTLDIVQEVGFLFSNDRTTRQKLAGLVKLAVAEIKQKVPAGVLSSPMDVVGEFLSHLFSRSIPSLILPKRCKPELSHRGRSSSASMMSPPPQEITHVLHSAPGYNHSQLVRLILGIYGGPPEPFQVLHCRSSTTEQELKLFVKRVTQHTNQQYLILEVNHLSYQLQEVLLQLYLEFKHEILGNPDIILHFVETTPSLFREVPWLKLTEYKAEGPPFDFSHCEKLCQDTVRPRGRDFTVELVYGLPGNGKTHYITDQLKNVAKGHQVTIAVNEVFSCANVIKRLHSLPADVRNCGIFFNFTILPPVDSEKDSEKKLYGHLMNEIGWFFFDLLILGYVEDPITGKSFRFPVGLDWTIYVEVPSQDIVGMNKNFENFKENVATLGLLGYPRPVASTDYCVDTDVQLVCKYLRAYETGDINNLYKERNKGKLVKFSLENDLSKEDCKQLLEAHMPEHIKGNKITQKVFIQYMKRRCTFLDNLPAFNYNPGFGEYMVVKGKKQRTDTRHLGSTLMDTMLKEVSDICNPAINKSWAQKPHQQLIYDFKDGGGSFGLISLLPDALPEEEKERFLRIGVQIPSMEDLYSRKVLDKYLSRALGVPLKKDGHLAPIDERNYVLTLDYTLKMLNIHERHECGVPVIIEGETGVGKTALVEMLSQLWNLSWLAEWERDQDRILDIIKKKVQGLVESSKAINAACMETVHDLSAGKEVSEEALQIIGELPDKDGQFYTTLNKSLRTLEGAPIFSVLDLHLNDGEMLSDAFRALETEMNSKATAHLLHIIFSAKLKGAFYKLNVHAALRPQDIKKFFEPVFAQADELQKTYDSCDPTKTIQSLKVPSVTAYLDEINTASCLGLFKEIIIDRTVDGQPIPENVFIIAACNPHRGDSLASHSTSSESWLKGSYYVRRLHPTLQFLMWDYGSLNEYQEREYVNAKMTMLNQKSDPADVASLTELIVDSQNKMREYAFDQLRILKVRRELAKVSANSSVSQRDIQRVFTFYQWLIKIYTKFNPHNEPQKMHHRRAVLVSLGLVYFMRLTSRYRSSYRLFLDGIERMSEEVTFSRAFKDELDWFIHQVQLPSGIAKTSALKENVFAIIACTVTHTPLIIVGEPGSSKTLSFNIAIANIKGKESRVEEFRDTDVFHSLDPHFYQCSRRTTSNEVDRIFKRAVKRQRSLTNISLPIYCVVFMDEAGLPEDKLESLKVLHYYLDRQEVSFVAISNHVLDAAKTNRAVSLYRPEATGSELDELAKGCIVPDDQVPPEKLVKCFCSAYNKILNNEKFRGLFGLRDFIHFITYLRRRRSSKEFWDQQLILESLERNFNGTDAFVELCSIFFSELGIHSDNVCHRSVLAILKNSLQDCTHSETDDVHTSVQSEVRYKLIIDPSEDDSLVRLLFSHGVLERENTRLYICSDFPGDSQMRVNTIAQIRNSVSTGHTILMCETDEIHESFYDLFNQRFRSIEDPKHGIRYYTNIAIGAHSKPCRVHPNFQCVVVIKKSEVEKTPAPFLNRFEKYSLSHDGLLETTLNTLPVCLKILLNTVHIKVSELIGCVEKSNLYGCTTETLNSLMLTLLPPRGHEYLPLRDYDNGSVGSEDITVILMTTLLDALRNHAGFHIPMFSEEELKSDCRHIFDMMSKEPEFEGIISQMTLEDIVPLVDEAFHVLHHSPGPDDAEPPLDIHTDSCMVISLLVQWLVSFLSKRLLQLLTPEALIVHAKEIPNYYLQSYLRFQEHFSLRELIEKQFLHLERNNWDVSVCATKLLCFTRSSPLIHRIPADYPSVLTTESVANLHEALKEHVIPNLSNLIMCKISVGHSQGKLEALLSSFLESHAQLLLLIANMQEISKKMINHLRILIEEAERQKTNHNKLIVLLLHFPPVMFFDYCYPSLFLQGWDHHYLDTIAHGTLTSVGVTAVVDIKHWFDQCCFGRSTSLTDDRMLKTLEGMLPEAIPVIASRALFSSHNNGMFSSPMDAGKRTKALEKLLSEMGIGKVLATKFCAYWKPSVMIEEMERVISFMYKHESTLNITDSIQTIFRSLFFDFLVYMVTKMNEEFNIDILFEEDCPETILTLFQKILEFLPVPDLTRLRILSVHLRKDYSIKKATIPKFPFFSHICGAIEDVIEESKEEVNQRTNLLPQDGALPEDETPQVVTDSGVAPIHSRIEWKFDVTASVTASIRQVQKRSKQENQEKVYTEIVLGRIEQKKNCSIVAAAQAVDNDPDGCVWSRYFEDFAYHKLHLESKVPTLTKSLLESYIGTLDNSHGLAQMVSLHVRLHLRQLDLTKVTRILRPISRMHEEMKTLSPTRADPAVTLAGLASVAVPKSTVTISFTALVVDTLFSFLNTACTQASDAVGDEKLNQYYKCCRELISMPALREDILSGLTPAVEAKLTVVHATYLMMQCCSESASSQVRQVFTQLYSQYFRGGIQGFMEPPSLKSVTTAGLGAFRSTATNFLAKQRLCVNSFMKGLFAFSFSKHRTSFNEGDCRWFMEQANEEIEFLPPSHPGRKLPGSDDPFHVCTSMNTLKFYLLSILDQSEKDQVLMLFDPKRRDLVGQVLMAQKDVGSPGPYTPPFYQLEDTYSPVMSQVMQQPLAYLYFVTVLECLRNKGHAANHLVRLAKRITELCNDSTTADHQKALLFIEKQAIIQVLLQQLATFFDTRNPKKIQDLFNARLVNGVNPLLDDPSMGGGSDAVSGHALVLALHVQKQLNSSSKLVQMLKDDGSTLVKTINCVKPLQSLIQNQPKADTHLFPFIGPDGSSSEMGKLYQQIFQAMADVHNNRASKESVDALVRLTEQSCKGDSTDKVNLSSDVSISKKMAFRMLLWLCAYHKFFCIKKYHSWILAETIGNNLRGVIEPEFIALLQSFIYPKYMLHKPEAPLAMDENAQRLAVTETPQGIQVVPLQGEGKKTDPIFELFNPPAGSTKDPSDVQLRHAMANVVAVILASQPRSNHLWYHMFAADALQDTYMTGFMYDSKVTEGRLYDCGVELTSDGKYGRPDYLLHASQSPLSLHSLYLILWANFAAFSMALLTQQDAQQKISGPVISPLQPTRHYCVSQLRALWLHMGNNLKLSLEEQSFFIMRCMHSFLELGIKQPQHLRKGLFKQPVKLYDYEKIWHELVFDTAFTNLNEEFVEYCHLWQNSLLKELSKLDAHYPHFPSMDEFSQSLLSKATIGDIKNPLYVITQFALEYTHLRAGGALLPDLIQLYWWMHTELAYRVTREYAENHSIEEVIIKADKHTGLDLTQLYERVRVGYNNYVEVVGHSIGAGACASFKREGRIYHIEDTTKLIHFLSEGEEGQANDWLYIVIADIINSHNAFLQKILQAVTTPEHSSLRHFFPEQLEEYIYPIEVNEHTCIVGTPEKTHGIDEHLQLVRSHFIQSPKGTPPVTPAMQLASFDFDQLQKEVIGTFLVGKPYVHSPESLRTTFKFRVHPVETVTLGVSDVDLNTLSEGIKEKKDYKASLDATFVKELECEFHSADYHTLLEVAVGLRTVTEHLIKTLHPPDAPAGGQILIEMTVPEFLLSVYSQERKENEIMQEIGIQRLSHSQMSCLLKLKLPYLYSTLELFVQWIKDGVYDFHQLPLVMKKHLEPDDEKKLREISANYKGPQAMLLGELQTLGEVLVHSESHLRKTIAENMQKPIITVLKELGFYGDEEHLAKMIPISVHCQHYVALRIAIRQRVDILHSEISPKIRGQLDAQKEKWQECALDIWQEHRLKHLWDIAIPFGNDQEFLFDPAKGIYAFQEGVENEEEGEEELVFIHTEPSTQEEPPPQESSTASDDEQSTQPMSLPSEQTEDVPPQSSAGPVIEMDLVDVAKSLTVGDVTMYLQSLKLGKDADAYISLFEDNGVDGDLMIQLKEDEVKDLGVENAFHRRKIVSKFKDFVKKKLTSKPKNK